MSPSPILADAVPARHARVQGWCLRWIEHYQGAFAGRPSPCRFSPTCSSYAHEAITVHGTSRGLRLTVRRLLRCRPFGPSGFDPVPAAADPPSASAAAPPSLVRKDT